VINIKINSAEYKIIGIHRIARALIGNMLNNLKVTMPTSKSLFIFYPVVEMAVGILVSGTKFSETIVYTYNLIDRCK